VFREKQWKVQEVLDHHYDDEEVTTDLVPVERGTLPLLRQQGTEYG
jgi:hypothetical protein